MVKLYGLKNCDTCRKALKWLADAGIGFEFYDVRKDGVPDVVLGAALTTLGAKSLLNTRSTTWRGLSEEARAQEPKVLLAEHPALIKRPLIVFDDWISVGWNATIITGLEARLRAV
jgi:arsenate reductase (glutaredoxin)